MPEENPYRYEGSAESLAKLSELARTVRLPSGKALFFAGVCAAIVAGAISIIFDKTNSSGAAFILIVFVLIPISVFVSSYTRNSDSFKAQILFWIAALPLPLALYYFGMPSEKHWSAAIVRDITKFMLISYGSEVFAAAATMGFMTYRVPRQR